MAVLRKNSPLSAVTCMISEIVTLAATTMARLACSSPLVDEVLVYPSNTTQIFSIFRTLLPCSSHTFAQFPQMLNLWAT